MTNAQTCTSDANCTLPQVCQQPLPGLFVCQPVLCSPFQACPTRPNDPDGCIKAGICSGAGTCFYVNCTQQGLQCDPNATSPFCISNPTTAPTGTPTLAPIDIPTPSPTPPTQSPTPNPTNMPTNAPTGPPTVLIVCNCTLPQICVQIFPGFFLCQTIFCNPFVACPPVPGDTSGCLKGGICNNMGTCTYVNCTEQGQQCNPNATSPFCLNNTGAPTNSPTGVPSNAPTEAPTNNPTNSPSNSPTGIPTNSPTGVPSNAPTEAPTNNPTNSPSNSPTGVPSNAPTALPTNSPTNTPSNSPTVAPTSQPTTQAPVGTPPTDSPTQFPTNAPSNNPTTVPTAFPTNAPTQVPSNSPTNAPTKVPTGSPSAAPTGIPTTQPTAAPTGTPTGSPTVAPTTLAPVGTPPPTVAPTSINCEYCGFSQGGYGAACRGQSMLSCPTIIATIKTNNVSPACLRDRCFLASITLGNSSFTGGRAVTFTTAMAINRFLPAGGTPGVFALSATNPTSTSAGVFAGQLLTAMLNQRFFQSSDLNQLYFSPGCLGVAPILLDYSIAEIIYIANQVIAGSSLYPGFTPSILNNALSLFNPRFERCNSTLAVTCFECRVGSGDTDRTSGDLLTSPTTQSDVDKGLSIGIGVYIAAITIFIIAFYIAYRYCINNGSNRNKKPRFSKV